MNNHKLHKCNDEFCQICDGGLSWCVICNGGEGSLPKECPGIRMTEEQEKLVYAQKLDFINGEWVNKTLN